MKLVSVMAMMAISLSAQAMVSIAENRCDKKFIANIKSVTEAQAPLNVRSVDLVDLEVSEVIQGEVLKVEQVEVLTFSALKPKLDEQYRVELNGKKICLFEPVDEVHEH